MTSKTEATLQEAKAFLQKYGEGLPYRRGEDDMLIRLLAMAILYGERRGLEQGQAIGEEAFDRLEERMQAALR